MRNIGIITFFQNFLNKKNSQVIDPLQYLSKDTLNIIINFSALNGILKLRRLSKEWMKFIDDPTASWWKFLLINYIISHPRTTELNLITHTNLDKTLDKLTDLGAFFRASKLHDLINQKALAESKSVIFNTDPYGFSIFLIPNVISQKETGIVKTESNPWTQLRLFIFGLLLACISDQTSKEYTTPIYDNAFSLKILGYESAIRIMLALFMFALPSLLYAGYQKSQNAYTVWKMNRSFDSLKKTNQATPHTQHVIDELKQHDPSSQRRSPGLKYE